MVWAGLIPYAELHFNQFRKKMNVLLFLRRPSFLQVFNSDLFLTIKLINLWSLLTKKLEFLISLFLYFQKVILYYLKSMEGLLIAFHIIKLLININLLLCHDLIFLTFLVLNRPVIHRNF